MPRASTPRDQKDYWKQRMRELRRDPKYRARERYSQALYRERNRRAFNLLTKASKCGIKMTMREARLITLTESPNAMDLL